jgi:hypothetical protein
MGGVKITATKNFANCITKGKEYEIIEEREKSYLIKDDTDFIIALNKAFFEPKQSINPQLEGFFIPDDWQRVNA